MKRFKIIVVLIILCSFFLYQIGAGAKSLEHKELMELQGVLRKNALEGGFYQLEGFRLTGDFDFSEYEGKYIIVGGVEDDSPSIYMVRGFKVFHLEVVEKEDAKAILNERLHIAIENSYTDQLAYILIDSVYMDEAFTDIEKYEILGELIGRENAELIFFNGKILDFESTYLPYIKNDRLLVPYETIKENTGADIEFTEEDSVILINKEGVEIKLYLNDNKALVNGESILTDTSAEITEGKVMVPLRFIMETLGADVHWITKGRLAIISYIK